MFCCNEKSFFLHFFAFWHEKNLQSKLICWPVIEKLIVRQMKDERPVEIPTFLKRKLFTTRALWKVIWNKHPTGVVEPLVIVGPFFGDFWASSWFVLWNFFKENRQTINNFLVQEAWAKYFAVHILKFETLQITWKKWNKDPTSDF